jgi:Ca2+-binding EF-hand superfamily protein
LIQQFTLVDKENNGLIRTKDLYDILKKTITSVGQNDIERFVRFLETDRNGKVNFTEFMNKISDN